MKQNQKAMSGISTLIIFIAMILVAAIAAIVLLQTVGTLQSQAVSTGKESQVQVSTQLQVLGIIGDVNQDHNQSIRTLRITAKLAPGSDSVRLSQMLIAITGGADANSFALSGIDYNSQLNYNGVAGNSDTNMMQTLGADYNVATVNGIPSFLGWNQGSPWIDSASGTGSFYTVRWLTTVPSQKIAISEGDLVEIYYRVNNKVNKNQNIEVRLIPLGGTAASVKIKTPVSFTKVYEQLFP